jgi:tetratricopeptide (TPR) repeat protein
MDEKQLAKDLFNGTWDLLDSTDRSSADDERMVHMAHASRYHWGQVGSPENRTIGDWQISRVYAVLGRSEPALHHARQALEVCDGHGLGDFHRAYAYEALARGHAVAGETDEARRYTEKALAESVSDEETRTRLLADLGTIPGQTRFW